jgi:hypothetical protein
MVTPFFIRGFSTEFAKPFLCYRIKYMLTIVYFNHNYELMSYFFFV